MAMASLIAQAETLVMASKQRSMVRTVAILLAARCVSKSIPMKASDMMRLLVQSVLVGLQAIAPLAVLVVVNEARCLIRDRRYLNLPRLTWYGISAWALAETLFLVYIMDYRRWLNSQTTRRWQAITTHSTEERRRLSMDRYLLALTQVCKAGAGEEPENGVFGNGKTERKPRKTLTMQVEPPRSMSEEMVAGLNSSSRSGKDGAAQKLKTMDRQASVHDFLKLLDGKDMSDVSDEALQRLRWHELASFFIGTGKGAAEDLRNWLYRGNVEEWVCYYWFRGAKPDELRDPRLRQELKRLVDRVLEDAGLLHMKEGTNLKIRCIRLMTDPLPVVHRPLFVYAGTSLLCPLITHKVMNQMGFRCERVGGLAYWRRPRRNDVPQHVDLAATSRTPLVFIHGLGVGLVPYYLFIYRLSQRYSGDFYVPELPFLAMAPWESVPSAREVVAQLQDMLGANGHAAAHFTGHSFGSLVVGWVMKMSPSSVLFTTMMEPAQFMLIKSDVINKVLFSEPQTCFDMLIRYFAFRELFTVNLLCRNFFWEQSSMWPEDLHVPAVIELAGGDGIVPSLFVRRLLEHERTARVQQRRLRKKPLLGRIPMSGSSTDVRVDTLQAAAQPRGQGAETLDILWLEDKIHGEILLRPALQEKLFTRMRSMVHASQTDD